jgi:hypothetical protein
VDGEAQQERLRIGTREREEAMQALGDHFAEGRLPMDEYEERITGAIEAQTFADLRELFHDLPRPHPKFMAPEPPPPPLVPAPIYPAPVPPPYYPPPAYPPSMYISDKSKMVAGVLQIVLPFGTGRFYTGHVGIALAQLFTVFFGVGIVWSFIDGIILLIRGGTDHQGRKLRDA